MLSETYQGCVALSLLAAEVFFALSHAFLITKGFLGLAARASLSAKIWS